MPRERIAPFGIRGIARRRASVSRTLPHGGSWLAFCDPSSAGAILDLGTAGFGDTGLCGSPQGYPAGMAALSC